MREVTDEYGFIGAIDGMWPVDSITIEWLTRRFRERYREEINEPAYVNRKSN
jgi:aconitase A